MKWVLVDNNNVVVSNYEVNDKYGLEAAKFYFMGRKRLSEERFDGLWKVVSEKEHKLNEDAYNRKSSSDPTKRWWKEEGDYLDLEKL